RPRLQRERFAPSARLPAWVVRPDLVDASAPVHERYAVEFVLEPVEEGVDARCEADRRRAREPLVRDPEDCANAIRGELPADDAFLALRELLPGLDIPLVLEDSRRLPR